MYMLWSGGRKGIPDDGKGINKGKGWRNMGFKMHVKGEVSKEIRIWETGMTFEIVEIPGCFTWC